MSKPEAGSSLHQLEKKCREFIESDVVEAGDAAHDINHIIRVVTNAKRILTGEKADAEVTIAAAWLHDCVILPKDHPGRKTASKLAAVKAGTFLSEINIPLQKIQRIKHAIEAHSFSAGIVPQTKEAEIVQDADRLDALGAIGIARCLMIGGRLDRPLYHPDDPLAENRVPDDSIWTVDHFFTKLFRLPEMMHTETGKQVAKERMAYMKKYLEQLDREIG